MDDLRQDLRWAARSIARNPLLATAAVVTLALGIGAGTAVFSVVHGLLLKPLPYAEPDRLVSVWPEQNFNKALVRRIAEAVPALEGISGISNGEVVLTGDGSAEQLRSSLVSVGHFALLGVRPALGRSFRPEESVPGEDGVVILSHGLWTRRLGGDPGILGRTVRLSGAGHESRTVIGVLPEGYRPVSDSGDPPQLWMPLADPESWTVHDDSSWYVNWRVGRLAPGATREQATAQLRAEALRLRSEGSNAFDEEVVRTAEVVPLGRGSADDLSRPLWLLMGAVGLVLLIACANVANLLLARGEARERELAVRRALGAGRLRIARQLLTESAILGVAGGLLGIAIAYGAVEVLAARAAAVLPRTDEVAVDGAVLLFALASSLLAAVVFGALPALQGSRGAGAGGGSDAECLRSAGRGALGTGRSGRLPRWLIGAEVALAVVVLVASGLMLRSLHSLYAVDPGFDPSNVLAFQVTPPEAKYPDPAAANRFYDRLLERIGAMPGVRSAGGIQLLPLTGGNWGFPSYPEGFVLPEGDTPPSLNFRIVRPGYMEAVRMPLLAGRRLADADGLGDAPDLAVVNETLAREYFPGGAEAALGRKIRFFGPEGPEVAIVGVVGDVRQFALDLEPQPEVYVTSQEWTWPVALWMVVRTDGDPMRLAGDVRRAVAAIDPDVPVARVDRMEAVVARSAGTRRFVAVLLTAFGALALVLGAIGVFGVTSYTVARRLPELGLRKALGATPGGLVGETLRRGLRPVAAGVAVGVVAALLVSRLLASLLFGVAPRDPATLAAAAGFLLLVGTAAVALPALRASKVDPMRVLRDE